VDTKQGDMPVIRMKMMEEIFVGRLIQSGTPSLKELAKISYFTRNIKENPNGSKTKQ